MLTAKKILSFMLCCALLLTCTIGSISAATTGDVDIDVSYDSPCLFAVTDADFSYKTQGRTFIDTNKKLLFMNSSASTFEFNADCANDVVVEFLAENVTDKCFFTVIVDGVVQDRDKCVIVEDGVTQVTIAEGLAPGKHTFKFIRQSDPVAASVGVASLKLSGRMLAADKQNSVIEFVGDGITTAVGNIGNADSTPADSTNFQDATKGYAYLTAQKMSRDLSIVGVKDMTIATGTKLAKDIYPLQNYPFDKTTKYQSETGADIVVISLGSEDMAKYAEASLTEEQLKAEFAALLQQVSQANPAAQVVWAYGMKDKAAENIIKEVVAEAGGQEKNFYSVDLSVNSTLSGAGNNLSAEDHALIADKLYEFLTSISFVPGDINGDKLVDLSDVATLSQYCAAWENITYLEAALDPNGDGVCNLSDVAHLAQYLAGWENVNLSVKPYRK